jgi:hypothetical protein
MRNQPIDFTSNQYQKHQGWLFWPGRHPGVVLLGTLVVAILAFRGSAPAKDVQTDSTGEDVPLFV